MSGMFFGTQGILVYLITFIVYKVNHPWWI